MTREQKENIKEAAAILARLMTEAGSDLELYCNCVEITRVEEREPRYVYEITITENVRVT